MAGPEPLSRLVLAATSVADDLGFVAVADLAGIIGSAGSTNYRVIGGHMVSALLLGGSSELSSIERRVTFDLGVPPIAVREHALIERLADLGYEKIVGNRFARTMMDVPVVVTGAREPAREAIVDILVPAYTSRARQNRRIGDHLVTTEVLGLATALIRAPVVLTLELHRLNGETLDVELSFPDEIAALVLKGFATRVRVRATDVVDVWRCLEVAFAAGVDPTGFAEAIPAEGAALVRTLFDRRDGVGMTTLTAEQRLSDQAADARFTRIQALIARVVGAG